MASFFFNVFNLFIGSKSLYCIYFWASWTCFSVTTSPNRNLCGWNLERKWQGMVRTHIRKVGEIAPGVPPQGVKAGFVFFVINATRPLGHLSCTDFDHFWNNRRESLSAYIHQWKIFQFLCTGVSRSQNSLKYGTLGYSAVIELELKRHICGRWKSFRGG